MGTEIDSSWENERLKEEIAALRKDAERLRKLETLFERRWNGIVGSGCQYSWQLIGPYRHTIAKMQGETFAEALDALDAAMKGEKG